MIPLSRIIAEIEKHASAAKLRDDESSLRDSLVAIRALCNVALEDNSKVYQPTSVLGTPSILKPEPTKEEDANGDSLFDF